MGSTAAGLLRRATGPTPRHRLQALLAGEVAPNGDDFIGGVAGEGEGEVESPGQAGVGFREVPHFGGIAGNDHDEFVAVVLRVLQQRVDRVDAEGVASVFGTRR